MPLYLVATPIGNLEDITLRALRVLKEADLIACEDTRHTRKLLNHFGIQKPTIRYHEHNELVRAQELTARLQQGESIALVTDAGTPGISDPAYRLVVAAIEQDIKVIPIPGATALIAGLIGSGLPTDAFLFIGFLPAKRNARREKLEALRTARTTLVLYEAPHRIQETLSEAQAVFGNRQAALARELTKLHEQFLRGTLADIRAQLQAQEPRGEMTLVIAGANETEDQPPPTDEALSTQLAQIMQTGISRNDALKQLAKRRGLSKKEAYRLLLEEKDNAEED
ncbi:MAG TPA: 16S rRNA (cytidine(1402)-2'-O)-methyltransferase [Blastocatellia bacterium]|nr:16S rRNA (cytidine(1402)-2'-O)-methyltransferase [Blastocatellia bacterium]